MKIDVDLEEAFDAYCDEQMEEARRKDIATDLHEKVWKLLSSGTKFRAGEAEVLIKVISDNEHLVQEMANLGYEFKKIKE